MIGTGLVVLLAALVSATLADKDSPDPKNGQADNAQKANPQANNAQAGKVQVAQTADLGGPQRYLTHLSTDKPIYRPGEKMYVRGVILDAANHRPLAEEGFGALVQINGPKGDIVAQGFAAIQDSVLGFQWDIPAEQAGGEYSIKVSHPMTGHPPAERKFDIRAYRAPRLKSQIVFVRDGYGPGDEVAAGLSVQRAEGGVPAGAPVTIIARVDGVEVHRGRAVVDEAGNCHVRFKLPEEIARGDGTLALVIDDRGVVETASKTIPILLQTIDLQLFPEGGDLVAGLPTRMYIEGRTPAQDPADMAGVVVDAQGKEVASFRTEHDGRGRLTITPQAGEKYTLKITEPSGIKTTYPLPEVKEQGGVIAGISDVSPAGEPVRLKIGATAEGTYRVTLSKREVELASAKADLKPREMQEVTLTPPDSADGVLIATLWGPDNLPLAERLVFRQVPRQLKLVIEPDRSSYVPGGRAKITVRSTDDEGKPIPAVIGITVTDESVLEMIDKRDQSPRLPVMVLLENDVQELADAHVYLSPSDPRAPLAVDLLLGTQGWRRFALVDVAKFIEAHGDAARRVLALRMATVREEGAFSGGPGGVVAERLLARADGAPPPAPGASPRPAAPAAGEDAPQQKGGQANDPAAAPAEPLAAEQAADNREPAANQRDALVKEEQPARQNLRRALEKAQQAARKRVAGLGLADEVSELSQAFVLLRVYAHEVRPDRKRGDRVDFTETLFWSAGVRTDEKTGEATIEFGLSDAVTSFRVLADGFTSEGALGEATSAIEVRQPFYIEPKMPLEVTSGDVVRLPIGLINSTAEPLSASIGVRAAGGQTGGLPTVDLRPGQRLRQLFTIRVSGFTGATQFTFDADAGAYADKVTRPLLAKPLGFPIIDSEGGLLQPGATASHKLTIADNIVSGSLKTTAQVYPTPLANLTAALERLIQEPYGCFEQTSSTTYPLVMAQQYFMTHQGVDPQLIERASGILDKGYKRLIGFECKQHGYEWFGEDPGHEALTAYALLEFSDMSQVYTVDLGMVARTRTWLLAQRDGQGGFKRARRALHTWIEDRDVSNTYILWALLAAGEKDLSLTEETAALTQDARKSTNSYVWALAANALHLNGEKAEAAELMERLVSKQETSGAVGGATQSIVGSGGEALAIETTSLAVLAWLKEPKYAGAVEKAIKFLAESCEQGRYGSTQSTVLALKAIVEYDKSRATPKAPGSVELLVDGKRVGETVPFDERTQGTINLPDFSKLLAPGEHTIELRMQDGSNMPYSLAANYYTTRPNSSAQCQLDLHVALSDGTVIEGGITEANVTVVNKSGKPVPTPVAIIGIPGGLEVRHDQLKELVKAKRIAAYEVLGRDVVLYWRDLDAGQKVELSISLTAAIPGTYTGPASRAYLYYTDEHKIWVAGMKVEITPQGK
jgi:uncharacterized protein YfaS (alpha-2-macroglobulin family)